jgi:GNAT superfamily N-acetyltransferase
VGFFIFINMIEKILEDKYKDALIGLDIYEDAKSIKLSRIVVNPDYQGQGIGTNILNDLIQYADRNKKIVTLTPSSDFGGNKNRLTQFYKRFGFKMNKGVHKSYEYMDTMVRWPKLSENQTTSTLIKKLLREGLINFS